jgi:hypothetical protein
MPHLYGELCVGTANGMVLGTIQVVDKGPATQRFNLLTLSEGYQASEMAQFSADAHTLFQ